MFGIIICVVMVMFMLWTGFQDYIPTVEAEVVRVHCEYPVNPIQVYVGFDVPDANECMLGLEADISQDEEPVSIVYYTEIPQPVFVESDFMDVVNEWLDSARVCWVAPERSVQPYYIGTEGMSYSI